MILKRYKGYEKSAAEQQVSAETLLSLAEGLDDFAVIEETYRELLDDRLDAPRIRKVAERIDDGDLAVADQTVDSPTPLAFGARDARRLGRGARGRRVGDAPEVPRPGAGGDRRFLRALSAVEIYLK